MGHNVVEAGGQGAAQVIVFNQKENMLEGGVNRRPADGGAALLSAANSGGTATLRDCYVCRC